MLETNGKFYLGRIFDPKLGKTTDQPLLYEPADLTTHAVVVGMTGSGKTGLCIDLLEEAALNDIPALMIDPKGDITNPLLHFPDLLPQDFQPWVNPDQARRAGKSLEQAAAEAAAQWKQGLTDWGIDQHRLIELSECSPIRGVHPRLGCGHPGQHPGIIESAAHPLGEQPGNAAREDLRHGDRPAGPGGHEGYRPGALA